MSTTKQCKSALASIEWGTSSATNAFTTLDGEEAREDWQLSHTARKRLTGFLEAGLRDGVVDGVEVEVYDILERGHDYVRLEDQRAFFISHVDVEYFWCDCCGGCRCCFLCDA